MKRQTHSPAVPVNRKLTKIAATENQVKVIRDKYLRDAPSIEAWLDGITHNIALAEILYHPDAEKWGVFKGVKYQSRLVAGPSEAKQSRLPSENSAPRTVSPPGNFRVSPCVPRIICRGHPSIH